MNKLNFKSYSLDKVFEIKGFFSDQKEDLLSDNMLSGILTYKHDNIVLELFGNLNSLEDEIIGTVKAPDVIYGYTSDGKLLIINCYGFVYGTDHSPGFTLSKYHVKNFKIYDIYYQELDKEFPEIIDYLSEDQIFYYDFSFDNIEQWIGKSVFSKKKVNGELTVETKVSDYQTTNIFIPSRNLFIEDRAIASIDYNYLNLSSRYYLRISNDNDEITFTHCHETACQIKNYIELITGTPLSFTEITFLSQFKLVNEGKRLPLIKGKYFFQHNRDGKIWEKYKYEDITLNALHDNFAEIMDQWFTKSEKLDFIIKQYTKNLHSIPYIEDSLLSTIRNLEVYARNFHEAEIRLFEREYLKSRKNKKNSRNKDSQLRSKLTFLFENADSRFKEIVIDSFSGFSYFIDSIIQTRNYYTHGDVKSKYPKLLTDYNKMYEANTVLQRLLHYYLYQELGMNYNFMDFSYHDTI